MYSFVILFHQGETWDPEDHCVRFDIINKCIASSGASLPKASGKSQSVEHFWNNFEEYATTNETDFMGSVTMSPASGRQQKDVRKSVFFTLHLR